MPLKKPLGPKLLNCVYIMQFNEKDWATNLPLSPISKSLKSKEKLSPYISKAAQIILNHFLGRKQPEISEECLLRFKEVEALFHQGNSIKENPSYNHDGLQLITLFIQVALSVDEWENLPTNKKEAGEIFIELTLDIFYDFFNRCF